MMSCKRFMRQIPLAVGQDLDPERMRSFDAHLRRCLSCYREFRDYADALSTLDPLRAPGDYQLPAGLSGSIHQGIMDELRADEPGPLAPHPTPIWSRSSRTLRYGLPLAAGFLVFLLAGMYAASQDDDPPGHQPQIPQNLVKPVVRSISGSVNGLDPRGDQFGSRYILPDRLHPGQLRLVGPVPVRRSEPLPPVAIPISKRNDF